LAQEGTGAKVTLRILEARYGQMNLAGTKRIHRFFDTGEIEELDDEVVREYHLHMSLDGEAFVEAVVSPSLIEEFVVGFLRTRGFIQGIQDILSMEVEDHRAAVTRGPHLVGTLPVLSLIESTGSRNVPGEGLLPRAGSPRSSDISVTSKVLMEGVRMLSEMPLYKRTGGTHCAILFSSAGNPLASAEDIGRHNAVDKVIGSALMKGLDFGGSWLAVSGRLPADMVLKPALVGIPLVASVSAPTTEGIDMGDRAGVTVVGFTRGGRLNCYTHRERITP
jgi:FdhD protein